MIDYNTYLLIKKDQKHGLRIPYTTSLASSSEGTACHPKL